MTTCFKIFFLTIFFSCLSVICFCQTANDYYKYGYHKNEGKEYDSAIYFFSKAMELNSAKAEYFIGRGVAEAYLKKYRAAMADYRFALTIDSNNAIVCYNIACLYSITKDVKNAFLYLKKAAVNWTEANDFRETVMKDPDMVFVRKQKEFPRFLRKYAPLQ